MALSRDVDRGEEDGVSLDPAAERWRRAQALFEAAMELDGGERAAFLARESAGDETLAREVSGMLAGAERAGDGIANSVRDAARQLLSGQEWIGRRLGPYRIVREIGRGGMGIVFEGVRDDDAYQKRVALKVGRGIDDRLRVERQILAGLEHPHIARFLEGGCEDGVPYLVMEYVDGRAITAWCDERQWNVRQRIALFRQVCLAVHYAHENMIVHRDLKPANILVDRNGAPKLLDFGIAKLLAPEADSATTGMRLWTPDYTSPEQVRGRNVTARTDVYSLGLILYELLCGSRAQIADTTSPLALDHSICERDAPPASACAALQGKRALSRELSGDLDTIAAMAMRKEPQRRYGSAAELAADLDRYLEERPVVARANTTAYRFVKLVRRQRLATALAALLVGSVAAGVVATVHQARRAERRFDQVRSLANTFIFDVHDRIRDLAGATEARQVIVATALRYLESIRQDAGSDAELQLELGAAYQRIGDVQGEPSKSNLGDSRGALASYRRAEALLTPLSERGNARAGQYLTGTLMNMALVRHALGEGGGAIQDLERARTEGLRMAGAPPPDAERLRILANVEGAIARLAAESHDAARAQRAAEDALLTAQRMAVLEPGSIPTRDFLAAAQSSAGSAYKAAGELEKAGAAYRAAVATREQIVRDDPTAGSRRRTLMLAYGHLGDVLGPPRAGGSGDLEGAAAAFRKAQSIARQLCESDPADRKARFDLANADFRLGTVLAAQKGHAVEGLAKIEEAERTLGELQKGDAANASYRLVAVLTKRRKGEALVALGRDAEASRAFAEVITLAESFRGTPGEAAARTSALACRVEVAKIRARAGDAAVIELADQSVALLRPETASWDLSWGRAEMFYDLASVYRRMGRAEVAEECLRKSERIWREMRAPALLESRRLNELALVRAQLR